MRGTVLKKFTKDKFISKTKHCSYNLLFTTCNHVYNHHPRPIWNKIYYQSLKCAIQTIICEYSL